MVSKPIQATGRDRRTGAAQGPCVEHESPRRTLRNWMLPVGLAVVAGAAIVGLVVQTTTQQDPGNEAPTNETPVEVGNIRIDTDSERPSDLVVSGWYTTRSYGPAIENTAAPALDPVVIGESAVLPGTVSCIPFQALGPNADLAPDPTGQRSSGVEILDELRQRGPNVDLGFDPNGQRSSGQDPICVGG